MLVLVADCRLGLEARIPPLVDHSSVVAMTMKTSVDFLLLARNHPMEQVQVLDDTSRLVSLDDQKLGKGRQ